MDLRSTHLDENRLLGANPRRAIASSEGARSGQGHLLSQLALSSERPPQGGALRLCCSAFPAQTPEQVARTSVV